MICSSPELAAADRRLDRAYRDAIRRGVSARELRRAQDQWLNIREDAASDIASVAAVYSRRVGQLEQMAR